MARQLKKAGVGKVRPLEGGFEAWLKLGLPVEPVSLPVDYASEMNLSKINPDNVTHEATASEAREF